MDPTIFIIPTIITYCIDTIVTVYVITLLQLI